MYSLADKWLVWRKRDAIDPGQNQEAASHLPRISERRIANMKNQVSKF